MPSCVLYKFTSAVAYCTWLNASTQNNLCCSQRFVVTVCNVAAGSLLIAGAGLAWWYQRAKRQLQRPVDLKPDDGYQQLVLSASGGHVIGSDCHSIIMPSAAATHGSSTPQVIRATCSKEDATKLQLGMQLLQHLSCCMPVLLNKSFNT